MENESTEGKIKRVMDKFFGAGKLYHAVMEEVYGPDGSNWPEEYSAIIEPVTALRNRILEDLERQG
jgi:hypothetical protein